MSRRHKIDEALLFALHIATRPNGPATAKGIALLEEALRLNFHCKCGDGASSDKRDE